MNEGNKHKPPKPFGGDNAQLQKFMEAAHEMEGDGGATRFDAALKKVARHKPPPDKPQKGEKPTTKKPGR